MVMDDQLRAALRPALEPLAAGAARVGLRPVHLTVLGLALAVGAAGAAALGSWLVALVLWLVSRLADGVDGALARRTGTADDVGGFLDIVADFAAYGGYVFGVAVGAPSARLACAALLLSYYLNGSAFLALSGLAERRARRRVDDGDRSVWFVGGLTEGFETIVAHGVIALVGHLAVERVVVVVWVFTAMVGVTVLQRVAMAVRVLRPAPERDG